MALARVILEETLRVKYAVVRLPLSKEVAVLEAFASKVLRSSNPNAKEIFALGVERGLRHLKRKGEIPKFFETKLNHLVWLSRL